MIPQNLPQNPDPAISPVLMPSRERKNISAPQSASKKVDDKLLSHLQADFYIHEAPGQEGHKREETLDYLIHCLQRLPPKWITPETQQLIEDFEKCLSLAILMTKAESPEKLAATLQELISKMQPGERLLVPGGWNGMGLGALGHAMLYMIRKQEDGNYTLETYNSGSGINIFHEYTIDVQGYQRFKPVVIYKDIAPENMLSSQNL